jgi:hypothetical protein
MALGEVVEHRDRVPRIDELLDTHGPDVAAPPVTKTFMSGGRYGRHTAGRNRSWRRPVERDCWGKGSRVGRASSRAAAFWGKAGNGSRGREAIRN